MKTKALVSILVLFVVSCFAVTMEAAEKGDIIIASANPMTGNSAQFGQYKVKGINLAIDQANLQGGINGRKIRLIIGDDQGNPKEAAIVAQRMVGNKDIIAILGHWNSSCTLAAIPIYDRAKIPVITDSINRKISGISKWVFRMEPTDLQQGEQLANYIVGKIGAKRIAVLYAKNDYGQGQADAFLDHLKTKGIGVVANETYFEGGSDFTPQLSKIQEAKPDCLFIVGYYREGALIVQQMRRLDLNVPILGSDGFTNKELITLGGNAVEGVSFPGFFFPNEMFPGSLNFARAYEEKYGEKPESYGALAYDSTNMIIEAMKKKGVSKDALRDYLETMAGFEGVTGTHKFNKDHDSQFKIIILTVKNGNIVLSPEQL